MSIKQTISFLLVLPVVLLISCIKSQDPVKPPPERDTTVHVSGLTIDSAEFVLLPTLTRQLSVNFVPANASNKYLSWSSSDTSIASVNTSGLVTAVKTGTVNITATSNDNSSIKAIAKLTILKNYEVYAVGKGYTSTWNNCAIYWKNGFGTTLAGGYSVGSEAFAIKLSGADTYIAGSTIGENLFNIATYWKNGVPQILGDYKAQNSSYAEAIVAENNKVYVAGHGFFNTECPVYCYGRFRASYWVDAAGTVTQIPLYDNISSTKAYGIALNGSDIIIAGGQAINNNSQWSTFWKNNVANVTALSDTFRYHEARAVALNGNDLFYAGYGICVDAGCISTAMLWKNDRNNVIHLTDGTKEGQANCLAFSGTTIYVGGFEKNAAGKKVAKLWKINGNLVSSLALSDGTQNSLVNGIAVSGNDIFLIGSESSKAKCWRVYEGLSTPAFFDLSDNYVSGGYEGYGICIK
jgi:hypothetical protein